MSYAFLASCCCCLQWSSKWLCACYYLHLPVSHVWGICAGLTRLQLKWPAGQLQMSNLSSIPCPMCLPGFGALLRLSRHVASNWMLWLQDLVPEFLITFCSTAPWSSVCQCMSSPCCLLVSPSSAGAGVCMTTFCFPVAECMWCMGGRAKTCFQHLPTVFAFLLWWYQSRFVGWKPVRMRLQWCISGVWSFLQEDSVVTSTRSWRCVNLTRLLGKPPLRSVTFMMKKVD